MNKRTDSFRTQNGDTLDILLKKPEGNKPHPVIIFVQGFGMTMHEYKNSFDEIANKLVENGFVTIQFNFSYINNLTDKTDTEIPLSRRSGEVRTVINWVRSQPDIDKKQIGILAQSFGVSTVLLTDITDICSLCFVSGIGFYPAKFIKRYVDKGAIINRNGQTRLPRTSGKTTLINPDFWQSFDSLNQEILAEKIAKPVLVIHGDRDSYITTKDMKTVYNAIRSAEKQLKVFSGGDHGITDVSRDMREEFLAYITEWFRVTL